MCDIKIIFIILIKTPLNLQCKLEGEVLQIHGFVNTTAKEILYMFAGGFVFIEKGSLSGDRERDKKARAVAMANGADVGIHTTDEFCCDKKSETGRIGAERNVGRGFERVGF